MQMATRLATQRNFVTITPSTTQTNQPTSPPRVCNQMISSPATSSPSSSPPAGNELFHITSVGGDEETVSVSSPNGTTLNAIPLQQLVHQKKFILNTETGAVSLIDIPSVDHSDSSNETVHTVQVDGSVSSKESSMQELTASGQSNEQNNAQQVTAQVAVVQAQNNDGDNSGPHFTIVSVSQDNGSHGYVQYVDSDLYTTAANSGQGQSQMAYPVYAVGDYSAGNQQYYTTTGTNFSGSPQQSPPAGSSANTYIVPVDEALLANQARESPQNISAVCWLMENYETAEGVSLPRSTLYNHYMRHCNEHKLDAVNAASFGKLIRSVFTGLRTRRLGTRGNSKYHYYGIRVKPGSTLVYALDEKPQGGGSHGSGVGGGPSSGGASSAGSAAAQANRKKAGGLKQDSNEACLQFLGDGTNAIPAFPKLVLPMPLPDDITLEDVDTLRAIYREHYEAFLDAILSLEFSTVDSLWHEFWRSNDNNNGDECEEEKYLTKAKLYKLCQCEPVQLFIKHVDFIFYQNMVDVLIPDVLRPIPSSLTQLIRNFAKNLENWLASAMVGCPEKIVQIKMSAVSAFSQTLRRYTSLNHLAQAARAVLQNGSQIAQMLNDLNRVDFHNVQEQASWVCQCDTATVVRLENDFKLALQQQSSLEQWASWLRLVVESALEEYVGKASYARAARQFLLKWSFYSSMVIRDLTLRSAASFGSFHLIRLLYDEYMFFIVEHKVAEATNTSPIAVMSEVDRMQHCASPDTDLEVMFSMPSSDYDNIKIESSPKRMRS